MKRPDRMQPVAETPARVAHSPADRAAACDLSVIIPAEAGSVTLGPLLTQLRTLLDTLGIQWEILVVAANHDEGSLPAAVRIPAVRLLQPEAPRRAGALFTGFRHAGGRHLLTMDGDSSHSPEVVRTLWEQRMRADVVVASRYVAGGEARMPVGRTVLSRLLNAVFRWVLNVPIRDVSSGFRLYRATTIDGLERDPGNFDVPQRLLVRAYTEGWTVLETPFLYQPPTERSSRRRIVVFGMDSLRALWSLWTLRNSILAADYDDRAYDSRIPLQRYWQRMRFRHITDLLAGEGPVLDVGCGSSRIIGALPEGSVGVDLLLRKLRYARRFRRPLVQASGFTLPFPSGSFPCVVCSQVIEHVPKSSPILDELCRVLRPGGRLVIGTPDYARWEWVVTEKLYALAAPGGYADEHIAHYTRQELVTMFEARGFALEDTRYILRGELILAFRRLPLPVA